jgi:pimeloyl-ACP methyl ester carboxylesterase
MDTFAEPSGGARGWIEAIAEKATNEGMAAVFEDMKPFFADAAPEIRTRVEHKVTNMDPQALVDFGRALGAYPSMVSRLGELTMPVTVLVGEHDAGLVAPAHVMADAIPGAELVVLPGCGHSPQEDDPEAWLGALGEHLARASA